MRRAIADLGKWLGGRTSFLLNQCFGGRAENSFGILMYHRISSYSSVHLRPTWNVSPIQFFTQVRGLLDQGYSIWPLRKVISQVVKGKPISKKIAVITFDDGYENVYLNAFPVLKSLNIPATIFVVTSCIGSGKPFSFDAWGHIYEKKVHAEAWQPLTWEQCIEMEQSGLVEIGSHAHTHRNFSKDPEGFEWDITTSLTVLRQKLGERAYSFAFPYGGVTLGFVNNELIEKVKQSGLICGLSTEIGPAKSVCSPFGWPRLEVVNSDTGATLKAKIEGWYNWMTPLREIFRVVSPSAIIE